MFFYLGRSGMLWYSITKIDNHNMYLHPKPQIGNTLLNYASVSRFIVSGGGGHLFMFVHLPIMQNPVFLSSKILFFFHPDLDPRLSYNLQWQLPHLLVVISLSNFNNTQQWKHLLSNKWLFQFKHLIMDFKDISSLVWILVDTALYALQCWGLYIISSGMSICEGLERPLGWMASVSLPLPICASFR